MTDKPHAQVEFGMVPGWVDEAVTDVTAMRVYVRLCRKYTNRDRFVTQRTLAAELGISAASVNRAIKHLRDTGVIQVERTRRSDGNLDRNVYVLPMDEPLLMQVEGKGSPQA